MEEEPEDLLPAFVIGAIIKSLTSVFGEIGGQTELDLLTFDEKRRKGILRVPSDFEVKLRAALSLISEFQKVPAYFQVNQVTNQLPAVTESFLQI